MSEEGSRVKTREGATEKRRRREINFATRFVRLTARVDFHEGVKDIYGADCPDRMFHSARDPLSAPVGSCVVASTQNATRTVPRESDISREIKDLPPTDRPFPSLSTFDPPVPLPALSRHRLRILMVSNWSSALERFNYVTLICFVQLSLSRSRLSPPGAK